MGERKNPRQQSNEEPEPDTLGAVIDAQDARIDTLENKLAEITEQLDGVLTALDTLGTMVRSTPTISLAAVANDRRARQGLLLWANRTQGGKQGPLYDLVEGALGVGLD